MKANLYINLWESKESGYIQVDSLMHESDIEDAYNSHVEFANNYTNSQTECFEGFKLSYIFLTVEYNGRKKRIDQSDVMTSLEKQGLIEQIGKDTTIFGGYYKMTDKLKEMMKDQFNQRKALINAA